MIDHLTKHGIPKLALHSAIINRFELTLHQQDCCEIYYCLRWMGDYFKQQLRSGTITREGITYLVVYKDCKPTEIKDGTILFMSFRKPAKEYELSAYVLVTIAW